MMEPVDLFEVAEEDMFLANQLSRNYVLHGTTLHLFHVALKQNAETHTEIACAIHESTLKVACLQFKAKTNCVVMGQHRSFSNGLCKSKREIKLLTKSLRY